jgi:hypothetical protein
LSSRAAGHYLSLTGQDQHLPAAGSRVILYAPRDQREIQTLEQIMNAAVWWVGGVDSRIVDESSC